MHVDTKTHTSLIPAMFHNYFLLRWQASTLRLHNRGMWASKMVVFSQNLADMIITLHCIYCFCVVINLNSSALEKYAFNFNDIICLHTSTINEPYSVCICARMNATRPWWCKGKIDSGNGPSRASVFTIYGIDRYNELTRNKKIC